MNDTINGIITHPDSDRKTDYLFRISMKSIIRNDKDQVLVVKETDRASWDLPGGGMDHNESIKEAIARELYEEVSLEGEFTYKVLAIEEPAFLKHSSIWQIRLILEVKPINMIFEPGEDGDEVMFINPLELKDSERVTERLVYKYSLLLE